MSTSPVVTPASPVLDIRDQIAMSALQGMLSAVYPGTPAQLSAQAYALADAMLAVKASSDPYGNP
jgi:hypothetical protein